MELLQAIIGWAIVIGIIYGVWWLSEIPHRNQWGKTIAWAKERGYTIPPPPTFLVAKNIKSRFQNWFANEKLPHLQFLPRRGCATC